MQCSPGVLEMLPRDHTPHHSLSTQTRYSALSTATTLFTRAAKSAHFLADREEKRLSIMYHGWTPSPSSTDKWEAAWLESGAFCNMSTSRLTLRCRLPKQIEHIQGAFPSPRCLGEHIHNAPNPAALSRINSDLKLIKSIKLELYSVNLPEGDSTCTNLYLYCTWGVAGAYLVFWVT